MSKKVTSKNSSLPKWVTMKELVKRYNEIADEPVESFASRQEGYNMLITLRNEKGITTVSKLVGKKGKDPGDSLVDAAKKAKESAKPSKVSGIENPYRSGTNCSKVFDMLVKGATVEEIMKSLSTTKKNAGTYLWWVKNKGYTVDASDKGVLTVKEG